MPTNPSVADSRAASMYPNRSDTKANTAVDWIPPHLIHQFTPRKHACPVSKCGEKFPTWHDLEDHKLLKGHWWCPECEMNFWDRDLLFKHNGEVRSLLLFFFSKLPRVLSSYFLDGR
jgi:hypothetical protein